MSHRASLMTAFALATCVAIACSSDGPASPSSMPAPRTMSSDSPSAPMPTPQPPTAASDATARYRLVFRATWSRQSHPVDFPPNPHFSPLVGATHDGSVAFWREAVPATAGIRDMAERGRTSPLDSEIRAAIAAGTSDQLIIGGGVDVSPGSASLEFDVRREFSLVTVVTMVAPSPDWFVGVSGLALYENDAWVQEREVPLVGWDAGTDSGTTFTSPDQVTAPAAAISRIATPPLAPNSPPVPLGTFTFTRVR